MSSSFSVKNHSNFRPFHRSSLGSSLKSLKAIVVDHTVSSFHFSAYWPQGSGTTYMQIELLIHS